MEIQISRIRHIYIIKLSGRWDAFSSPAFEQACTKLLDEGLRDVVIDAADVDYVSSFGLRSLLNLGRMLEPLRGDVHICALQSQVRKVFMGSGFNSIFPEYPDLESAVGDFKEKL